jgi:hypothetical protein
LTQKNPSSNSVRDAKRTIDKQINWWIVIGISLPLSFLAFLFFVNLFGHDTIYDVALTVGGTLFATIGFVWWWWAIYSISYFSSLIVRVSENFQKLQKDLKDLKKDINS